MAALPIVILSSAAAATRIDAHVVKSDVSSFDNFTYFRNDTAHGDQFRQKDDRLIVDGSASKTSFGTVLGGTKTETTIGVQSRYDAINSTTSMAHALEPSEVQDIHFHPLEPRSFRLPLTKQYFTPMNSSSIVSPTPEADERRVALLIPCGHA